MKIKKYEEEKERERERERERADCHVPLPERPFEMFYLPRSRDNGDSNNQRSGIDNSRTTDVLPRHIHALRDHFYLICNRLQREKNTHLSLAVLLIKKIKTVAARVREGEFSALPFEHPVTCFEQLDIHAGISIQE